MSKFNINLVGGGFTHHLACSSALNTNKFVNWVVDGSANTTVYVDKAIINAKTNNQKYNIAWLAESSAIIADVVLYLKNNIAAIESNFDIIITHDERLLPFSEKMRYVPTNALPWIQNKKIYKKSKKISLIGSSKRMCPGHEFRQDIIRKYSDSVDHFGRGFGTRELPWTYIDEDGIEESGKMLGLKDYYFSIAMENDNYDTIFCEKITDCFVTGTIPIFWGTKKISQIFNSDGIIMLEDFDPELCTADYYHSKMDAIKENFEIATSLLSAEDYMYLNYLKQ